MPRLVQAVPKYRKHKQSGQAIVTVNGRDYLLGPHGTKASHLEYDRLIAEWLVSGRSANYGTPQHEQLGVTVVELVRDYRKYVAEFHGTGPKSQYHRTVIALKPLRELYGKTPAAEFGVLQFRAVRQHISTDGRCRRYVNELMQRVVAAFKWAAGEGIIPAAVSQNLAAVPGLQRGKCALHDPDPIEPVDDAVVDATLKHLPDVVADMVRVQRLCGCRPAEVCMLRPCDLDRAGDVWTYRPLKHKTQHRGRKRTILFGPKAQAIFLRYLARDAETYCFRPCDSEAKRRAAASVDRTTPMSCGNKTGSNRKHKPRRPPGEQYDVAAYRRAIARACDAAFPHPELGGIRPSMLTAEQRIELAKWRSAHRWSPNQLRHAAATEVRRAFGLEAAQIILGHAKANVTEIYAERDLAKGVAVARALG